jgi:3',5'-cyclic AMP phosphodiesterase CpdA
MPSIRILHASDLHISTYKNRVSAVDHFAQLRMTGDMGVWQLGALAWQFYEAFRRKMTASSYDPVVLKFLAQFIYSHARQKRWKGGTVSEAGADKVDAIILSGDLATSGYDTDIDKVKEFLSAAPHPWYPYASSDEDEVATLAAIVSPVWYLPGNHDRFVPNTDWFSFHGVPFPNLFSPGGTNFDQKIRDYQTERALELGAVPDWQTGAAGFRVVVLAADFALQQPGDHKGFYGWLAQGCVYQPVLSQLVEKTEKAIARHQQFDEGVLGILWAIHFPPAFPQIAETNRLLFEGSLLSEANRMGVRAILAGHTHEQVRYSKPGLKCEVLCCGSSSQHVPPGSGGRNRFQIIDLSLDAAENIQINLENYVYKRAGQDGAPSAHFYPE